MTLDEGILSRKAAAVRSRVDRVREVVPADRQAFLGDRDRQELVTFNLILAVQALADLATLLISDRGWGVPETLAGSFACLEERGVLEGDLADRLQRAARMRNLLVHRYGDVDHRLVHEVATRNLDDLLAGVRRILQVVEANEGS